MNNRLYKAAVSAAVVAASIAVQSAPGHASVGFSDLDGSFAKDAILKLAQAGILNGQGDGKFNPEGQMNRAQFAKILALALNLDIEKVPQSSTFSDIDSSDWAYGYIEAAAKAGIFNGNSDGTFRPTESLTREQMAAVLIRALGVDADGYGKKLEFSDADQIADYAKDAVGYAVEIGIINGQSNGKFDPKGSATREAVALVAQSFIEKKKEMDESQHNPAPQPDPVPEPPAYPGDTSAPRISGITMESRNSNPEFAKSEDTVVFQFETSERVQKPVLKVNGHDAVVLESEDKIHWQAEYVIGATDQEGELHFTIDAVDLAGNHSTQATSTTSGNTIVIDKTAPVISGITNGETVEEAIPGSSSTDVQTVELKSDRDKNGNYETSETYEALGTPITLAGRYQLTVTDYAGNIAETVFKVNHNPIVSAPIEDRDDAEINQEIPIDISSLFSDIDQDELSFSATSNNPETASITSEPDGNFFYIEFLQGGSAEFTITADDHEGGTASETFIITTSVPELNHAPQIVNAISDQVVTMENPVRINLASVFTDPDNDELTFDAVSSNASYATASVDDGYLTITPEEIGSTTITVTASDGKGGAEEVSFQADVKDAMVLHLAFDDDIKDSSGYDNNGGLDYGHYSFVNGVVGKAIQFKGVDDPGRIKITNNPSLQFADKLTIAYWLRIDESKGQEGNFQQTVPAGIQSVFSKDSDNTDLFSLVFMDDEESGSVRFKEVSSSVIKGEWVHVAYVIEGNSITKYYNGQWVNEVGLTSPITFTTANGKDLYIGYQGNGWYPLYGTLDDFRIYKDALTREEVEAIYLMGTS
ncbi:S-layer homology domain-containing protein [Falsibacillus pallidus]|uniref:S-layer family protein n=1 Tax=Falsibacillus pallidus TaxID=493781 RepID=A0A370GA28_9BACI|nr:S-layer homology domain-containing protein [Falsibacillus pallidus]RDI40050.1 S-layer family protein [Falsibacillus pallidus]